MNAPSNLPAQRQSRELHPVTKLTQQLEERAHEFAKALPSHISPEKLQRTIVTAATSNPELLTADRQSLIVAAMKAAQDGLLPDGREAALVIFNTSEKDANGQWHKRKLCQYMPMVYGLRKKIVQSGEIVSLQTGLVYRAEMEAGAFLYEVGMEPPIRHRPMLDLPAEELTDDKIVAAYSMAKMKDGTVSVEVMRRGEIDKVREVSMTGATKDKKGNARTPKGPWVDWFGEMARKTVMRRHSKTLPMSGDIIIDVEADEIDAASRAAALLDRVEPDAPVALPSRDELVDENTGEVFQTDSRGMTEVDEETGRQLDAGDDANDGTYDEQDNPPAEEGPTQEQRGEAAPEATYHGAKPKGAKPGDTWWDGEKIHYAHGLPNGGVRWYLNPPESEVAAEEPIDPYRGQPWAEKRREIIEGFELAETSDQLRATDDELVRHLQGFPSEVQQELEVAGTKARRRINAARAKADA